MSKNQKASKAPEGAQAPDAPKKESKVLRQEETYTTTKKSWSILWKASVFDTSGRTANQLKKGILIQMYQSQEFFPSKMVEAILKDPQYKGWSEKDGVTEEALHEFLAAYAADRSTGVVRYKDRPRPMTQVELEEELTEAYGVQRQQQSVIQQQAEQLEELRKKLEEKKAA